MKEHVAWLRQHHDEQEVEEQMAALEQDVQHHVSEEENEMLPRIEQVIPEATRAALGRRMQARKRQLGATRAAPARAAARKRRASGARPKTSWVAEQTPSVWRSITRDGHAAAGEASAAIGHASRGPTW